MPVDTICNVKLNRPQIKENGRMDRAGKGVGLREASQEVQLKTLRDTCLEHWYAIAHENQHLTTASLKQRIEEQVGAEGDSIRVSFYVYQSQFAASIWQFMVQKNVKCSRFFTW